MIRVRALGFIATALGRAEIELPVNSTKVSDLLTLLSKDADVLRGNSTLIAVNGVEISALDRRDTILKSGDEVILIPISHGG